MLVTQSVRGDGKGESKPRNKRKYDEGARDKFRRDGVGSRPGQKLPRRARGDDDDDIDDAEVEDDDFEDDDDFDIDEDDDFDMDEDDDFEVEGDDDDWEKDDD